MNASRNSSIMCYPGQRFGNYELIRLLGQGGFAEVYLGKHIYLKTRAAVKVLHTWLTDDDVRKFLAEARIAARLVHPHIIRVLEFGLQGEMPFLIMDYAPNSTLRQHYPSGSRLAPKVIVEYVTQIADAVQYIHERGLIHRDIKPENLLLGRNNELLLSDFGITIAAQKATAGEQVRLGTVAYMAPEQLEGYPCLESDQYALGIVVYEWVCGVRPFKGKIGDIIDQHLFVPPSSLCRRVPDLPPSVENVVFLALAKDPRDRFESVQEFATALCDAFEYRPIMMIDDDFPQRPAGAGQPRFQQPKRGRENTGGSQKRKVWKEIAAFFAIDLLVVASLGCMLYGLGMAPLPLELLITICMVGLPLGGAFARKNSPLFFLTCCVAVTAALPALLFHALILFIVAYIVLLLLSLLTALAVSINNV